MRCRATRSFAGIITMAKGQEAELGDCPALTDLLRCGYVVSAEADNAGKESDDNGKAQRADASKRKSRRKS